MMHDRNINGALVMQTGDAFDVNRSRVFAIDVGISGFPEFFFSGNESWQGICLGICEECP